MRLCKKMSFSSIYCIFSNFLFMTRSCDVRTSMDKCWIMQVARAHLITLLERLTQILFVYGQNVNSNGWWFAGGLGVIWLDALESLECVFLKFFWFWEFILLKLLLIKILVVRMLLIITRYPSYNIVGESDANPVRL